ncbi:MAG: signal peptidase I [Candidatus Fimimonas sp.]
MQSRENAELQNEQPSATTEYVCETDEKNNAPRQSRWDKAVSVLLAVAIVVLVVVCVLKLFFFGRITVSGDSMNPNFSSGQGVWVSKRAQVQRGDVVVFYLNDVNKLKAEFAFGKDVQKGGFAEKYIKRVVALAGDKLWVEQVQDDYVLVIETPNGILREDYYTVFGKEATFLDANNQTSNVPTLGNLGNLRGATQSNPYVVSQGCFFALGDNRHNSSDSRVIGDVPFDRLYGVVVG